MSVSTTNFENKKKFIKKYVHNECETTVRIQIFRKSNLHAITEQKKRNLTITSKFNKIDNQQINDYFF